MQISQSSEELKALVALHSRCDLLSLTLLRCTARRAPQGAAMTEPFDLRAEKPAVKSRRLGGMLQVELAFGQTAMDSAEPPQEMFRIECVLEACYALAEGYEPSAEETRAFSEGNAVFNSWPYARQFLQDMATRMGYCPPPLPLLRFASPAGGEAQPARTLPAD